MVSKKSFIFFKCILKKILAFSSDFYFCVKVTTQLPKLFLYTRNAEKSVTDQENVYIDIHK